MQFGQNATRLQLVLAGAIAFMACAAAKGDYYVDEANGDDASSGSREAPFRTIQRAADVVIAGDTVMVREGTYPEDVFIQNSGSAGARITFRGQGIPEVHSFDVEDADYITVDGFRITGGPSCQIGFTLTGHHAQIINNEFYDVCKEGLRVGLWNAPDGTDTTRAYIADNTFHRCGVAGMQLQGRYHTVERNEIWGIVSDHPKGGVGDADGIRFFGTGHVLRQNYIHDILYSDPLNSNPHIDCFQTWGPAQDILIERNVCDLPEPGPETGAVSKAFQINVQGSGGQIVIRNNILHTFILLHCEQTPGVEMYNNLHWQGLEYADTTHWAQPVSLQSGCTSAAFKNNIFYQSLLKPIFSDSSSGTPEQENNVVYRTDGAYSWSSVNEWRVDPGFVDPAAEDFHLRATSPLIDAGSAISGLNQDHDGKTRPQGNSLDIGPYEYGEDEQNLPDNTAPSVPTNLTATGTTETSTDLSWTASTDNVGVTEYEVYQGSVVVKAVIGTTATITGWHC